MLASFFLKYNLKKKTTTHSYTSLGRHKRCGLSPVLFSLFTNEFKISDKKFSLFKYAADMAFVGLSQKNDPLGKTALVTHTETLVTWCCTCKLEINIGKIEKKK